MTKKDFNELAAQLAIVKAEIQNGLRPDIQETAWRKCVMAVMLACKATSANFDRNRFLTACGLPNVLDK